MNSRMKTLVGWFIIALVGLAGFVMNTLRIQYQNFNLYVALCIVVAVILVLGSRWQHTAPDADSENTDK